MVVVKIFASFILAYIIKKKIDTVFAPNFNISFTHVVKILNLPNHLTTQSTILHNKLYPTHEKINAIVFYKDVLFIKIKVPIAENINFILENAEKHFLKLVFL